MESKARQCFQLDRLVEHIVRPKQIFPLHFHFIEAAEIDIRLTHPRWIMYRHEVSEHLQARAAVVQPHDKLRQLTHKVWIILDSFDVAISVHYFLREAVTIYNCISQILPPLNEIDLRSDDCLIDFIQIRPVEFADVHERAADAFSDKLLVDLYFCVESVLLHRWDVAKDHQLAVAVRNSTDEQFLDS